MIDGNAMTRLTVTLAAILAVGIQTYAGAPDSWRSIESETPPSTPTITVLEATSDHLTVRFELDGVFMEPAQTPLGTYQRVHFGSLNTSGRSGPGEPDLPALAEMIRLPDGASGAVTVLEVDWCTVGEFDIIPAQYPHRIGSPPSDFIRSDQAYAAEGPIPEEPAQVGRSQGWGGVPVTGLSVTPLRYYPASRRLELARSITVRVDFRLAEVPKIVHPLRPNPNIERLQQIVLLNPPEPSHRVFDLDQEEPVRMLVVLKEEALETAMPLIDFHHRTGLRTEVWLADDIEDPGEIKDRVRELFEEGLWYLFIIGDGHEDHFDVPMFFWDPRDRGWQDDVSTASHSDSWFVCLDPPDEDGYEDHIPELAVGRLVYDSADELDELEIQIDKLMDYYIWNLDDRDNAEWISRALLVASDADPNDDDLDRYQYILDKQHIQDHDYELPSPDFTLITGRMDNASNALIIELINEDGFGIVNYRGHGNNNLWNSWNRRGESFRPEHVRQLDNRTRPFVLISSACKTANIATYSSDCLLEAFQKQSGGSLSAHGSVISTYSRGNCFFDTTLFQAWFDEGVYSLGYAANLVTTAMVIHWDQTWYTVIGRMNTRAYIWLGDPALELKIARPTQLEVDIPELVPLGTRSIEAAITADDEPIEGARFCMLSEGDEIYEVRTSDEEGLVEFVFDPPLEEPVELVWAVYERNGIPAEGTVMVADGFGVIQGQVTELANGDALEGAALELAPFHVRTVSDVEGFYRFSGMPATIYTLTVRAEGFVTQSREGIVLGEDDTVTIDIAMAFSRMELDSAVVHQQLQLGEIADRDLGFINTGNGTLEWSADIDFGWYRQLSSHEAWLETEDVKLFGVEFIDDRFYVAGGNNNRDPNHIYILDRDGNLIDQFQQPLGCAGLGIHDLAWDGTYLYGSSNDTIYILTLDGELVGKIVGPYDPNVALAADGEGNLWVGGNRQPLTRIDIEGNVLETIPVGYLTVRALAWHPEERDGFNLLLLANVVEAPVSLYKMNTVTEEIRFAADLTRDEEEAAGDGLSVTLSYIPGQWTLTGMVNLGPERYVRSWYLPQNTDWLGIEPVSGAVPPDEEDSITLTFDATREHDNTRLDADLVIENNSAEPRVEVPVTLVIGIVGVSDDDHRAVPGSFAVGSPYPNPFNATTVVPVDLPADGILTAALFDLTGRRVLEVAEGRFSAGRHQFTISAEALPSGVYLLKVEAAGSHRVCKLVLMR